MFKFWFHNCQQGEGQAQADSIWQLREFNFLVVVLRISFVLVLLVARGERGSARQLNATPTWKLQRQAANWSSVVCATYQCTRTNEKSCKFRKVKETLSNCCWCPPCFCGPPDSHGQVTKFAAKSCACGIEIDAPSKGTIKKWDEDERPHQLQSSSEIGSISSASHHRNDWQLKGETRDVVEIECGVSWMFAKLGSSHNGNFINWAIFKDQRFSHQCGAEKML